MLFNNQRTHNQRTYFPRLYGSLMMVMVLSACGGGSSTSSSTNSTTDSSSTTNTSGVLCSLTESGNQSLNYTQNNAPKSHSLAFNYTWSCTTSTRSLSGNGVPNHEVTNGKFATAISAQSVSYSVPFSPTYTTSSTSYGGPSGAPAYALNSVKFDPATAGTCPNTATTDTQCEYGAGGSGTWQMVALSGTVSSWKFDFGVDTSNAHVQPTGEYHYHGLPTGLISKRNNSPTTSMTLVGWARDGFPIYTQYGDSSVTTGTTTLAKAESGWSVKTTPDANRPSTANFAMGHFEQDWEYTGGTGKLDRCNGHSGATPEYPNGTYHYHITETYPFVQRCVYGKVS